MGNGGLLFEPLYNTGFPELARSKIEDFMQYNDWI